VIPLRQKKDVQRHTITVNTTTVNNDAYLRHVAESISAMTGKNVLGVAANIRLSMHSGAEAARAQIFREFSGAENWPESALEKSAVVHQRSGALGLRFAPEKAAICQLVVNALWE